MGDKGRSEDQNLDEEITEISESKKGSQESGMDPSLLSGQTPDEGQGEKETSSEIAEDYKEKFVRLYADFENFKKRILREKEELTQYANERILREIITIKDHIERALSHVGPETSVKKIQHGLELIHKELGNLLKRFNCCEISAVGKPFDPQYHEAIHQEQNPKFKPGAVTQEHQKGYTFSGRLLRPARVSVAVETAESKPRHK